MSKATNSELLRRKLDKFLTLEEYHGKDPNSMRVRDAFWAGVGAHKKLLMNKAKAAKRNSVKLKEEK